MSSYESENRATSAWGLHHIDSVAYLSKSEYGWKSDFPDGVLERTSYVFATGINGNKEELGGGATNLYSCVSRGRYSLCAASHGLSCATSALEMLLLSRHSQASALLFSALACLELPRSTVVSVLIRRPIWPQNTPFGCVRRFFFSFSLSVVVSP